MRLRIELSERATRRLIEEAVKNRRPVNLHAEWLLERLLLGDQQTEQPAEAQSGREAGQCNRK
jgi:hypothetical protein